MEVNTDSRETILQAAEQLILKHGYEGFSMRDLSQQSGFAKGTIYHHFRDKQEIFLSALERDFVAVRRRIAEAAASSEEVETRLRAVVETYVRLAEEKRHVILASLREIGGLEKEMAALIRRQGPLFLAPVIAILDDGIAQGIFSPVHPEMAVLSLFGMLNSFVTHRLLVQGLELEPEIVDHTLALFLNGIRRSDAAEINPAPLSDNME